MDVKEKMELVSQTLETIQAKTDDARELIDVLEMVAKLSLPGCHIKLVFEHF